MGTRKTNGDVNVGVQQPRAPIVQPPENRDVNVDLVIPKKIKHQVLAYELQAVYEERMNKLQTKLRSQYKEKCIACTKRILEALEKLQLDEVEQAHFILIESIEQLL